MFSQYPEDICEIFHMLGHHFTLHNHVIDINFNTSTKLWFKHFSHHALVGRSDVFQTEGHHFVMVVPNRGDKSSLLLIVRGQWYLVISLEGIQKTHPRMTHGCIHQLVYFGMGNGSLGQALLRSVKSTHTHHFPVFFFTTTVLANH